jgi:pimeloyl-ACP methyl ester carboxylesterase
MHRPASRIAVVLTLITLAGCADADDHGTRGDCNPVDPSVCALPFPSAFYLDEDGSSTSGYRVSFGPTSLPRHSQVGHVDPQAWNEKDGFSINSPMLTYIEGVSLTGTVSHLDIAAYAAADVKTVIVDVGTGERLPHWVELDGTARGGDLPLLILRPAVPMQFERHYVVGMRNLVRADGSPVPPSEGFLALRDGTSSNDPDVNRQRTHYDTVVFPALEAQGFARGEVQLAWAFRTSSRHSTIGQALAARDHALAQWGPEGPPYTIVGTTDYDCATGGHGGGIARQVTVQVTVPLYTEHPDPSLPPDSPGSHLTRGPDGMPVQNGTTTAEFIVRIPCTVAENPAPAPLLHYGHGLLGGYGEAHSGWLGRFADEHGYVVFASTWKGMSGADNLGIINMINVEPQRFKIVPERSVQGFVEFMAAARAMKGALADDDAMKFPDATETLVSVVDPEELYYYGNSQGGILGGAYTALSRDVIRGVLGVGGMPYSVLLPRSVDFDPFFAIFRIHLADHRERMLFITGLVQQLWDLGEGAGYAHDMDKDVLLQVGINDHQVTTLGAHIQARAWGAATVAPQTRALWNIEERAPGFEGSALVEFLYNDIMDEPVGAHPPPKETDLPRNGDPHECPRRNPAGQLQINDFLRLGVVNQYCDGICDGLITEDC